MKNLIATNMVFENADLGEGGGQILTATSSPHSICVGGSRSLPGRFEAIETNWTRLLNPRSLVAAYRAALRPLKL